MLLTKSNPKTYDMLKLYRQFIKAMVTGKRLQKNGMRVRKGTIRNYEITLAALEQFSQSEQFELRIIPTAKLRRTQFKAEKQYWKNFYLKFTNYLYKKSYDNYVGSTIKLVKAFFNYIEAEKNISISKLHQSFYAVRTEPPIYTLDAEQLRFLIYNKEFEEKLTDSLKKTKDIFVLGATVALRISDLMNLKQSNLIMINSSMYLRTLSQKTDTFTQVKLPPYAMDIVLRYKNSRSNYLLPQFYLGTFNNNLKKLGELAGWTYPVEKRQYKRGIVTGVQKSQKRFCDIMSSHMMRRTAITNMLIHQVDENVVRKISGHAPGSKEFYRYVNYYQTLVDEKTDKYFEALNMHEKNQKSVKNDSF